MNFVSFSKNMSRAFVTLCFVYVAKLQVDSFACVAQAVRVYERDSSDPERRTFVPGILTVINSTELRMPGTTDAPEPLLLAQLAPPSRLEAKPLRRSGRSASQAAAAAHAVRMRAEAAKAAATRQVRWVVPAAAENAILRNCW